MEKFNLTTKFQELNENNIDEENNRKEESVGGNNLYKEMLKTNFIKDYNLSQLMTKLNSPKTNSKKEIS